MAKFNFMWFGMYCGDRDVFVVNAKNKTKQDAIDIMVQENPDMFGRMFEEGWRLHGKTLRKPTVDDVEDRLCHFTFSDSPEYENGCYEIAHTERPGQFPVYAIQAEALIEDRNCQEG